MAGICGPWCIHLWEDARSQGASENFAVGFEFSKILLKDPETVLAAIFELRVYGSMLKEIRDFITRDDDEHDEIYQH